MIDSTSQRHCVDGRSHRNDQRGISSWLKKRWRWDYIAVRNLPVSGVEKFPRDSRPLSLLLNLFLIQPEQRVIGSQYSLLCSTCSLFTYCTGKSCNRTYFYFTIPSTEKLQLSLQELFKFKEFLLGQIFFTIFV